MQFATSKELSHNTGKIIHNIQKGDRYIITYRGKPMAVMIPYKNSDGLTGDLISKSYEEAWQDIENQLNETEPAFPSWEEAVAKSRDRK